MGVDLSGLLREGTSAPPSAAALKAALEAEGWLPDVRPLSPNRDLVYLRLAGTNRALIVLDNTPTGLDDPGVSLGYSSITPYTVTWQRGGVALHATEYWARTPGDAPLTTTDGDAVAASWLSSQLQPFRLGIETNVPPSGLRHPPLHESLAKAVYDLRARLFDAGILNGADPVALAGQDRELFQFIHQLLFVRFSEDRERRRGTPVGLLPRLETVLEQPAPGEGVARLLATYRQRNDSSLFEAKAVDPRSVPTSVLAELIRALVEPWAGLRIDFAVTPENLSGRLYQSFLQRIPAQEAPTAKPQLSLLPGLVTLDKRAERGVYYTPESLAHVLVDQTLGTYLDAYKPVRPEDIRICDPACGSGAFLVAAYRTLIGYFDAGGDTPQARSRRVAILMLSIFGADIDPTALLLCQAQLLELAEIDDQLLPDLSENLLAGDALVAPPGHPTVPSGVDWTAVTAHRGFDVVLMNPPFGAQNRVSQRLSASYLASTRQIYPEVHDWGADLAAYFCALGLRLLTPSGHMGVVIPRSLLTSGGGQPLRELFGKDLAYLADYRGALLFHGVRSYTASVVVRRGYRGKIALEEAVDSRADPALLLDAKVGAGLRRSTTITRQAIRKVDRLSFFALRWPSLEGMVRKRTERLDASPSRVVVPGTQTGDNRRFTVSNAARANGTLVVDGVELPATLVPRLARSGSIHPFWLQSHTERLILPFPEHVQDPAARSVLEVLIRKRGGMPPHPQPGALDILSGPKVLIRTLAVEPCAAVDSTGEWTTIKGTGGGHALAVRGWPVRRLHAVAALLNSSFYQWLLRGNGTPRADESVEISLADLRALPWPDLAEAEWDNFAELGEAAAACVRLPDEDTRVDEYWAARQRIDNAVFELLRVDAALKELVAEELLREG